MTGLTGGWCASSLAAAQRPRDRSHGVVKAQRRGGRDEARRRRHDQHEARPVRHSVVDAPRPARQAALAVRRDDVEDESDHAADRYTHRPYIHTYRFIMQLAKRNKLHDNTNTRGENC